MASPTAWLGISIDFGDGLQRDGGAYLLKLGDDGALRWRDRFRRRPARVWLVLRYACALTSSAPHTRDLRIAGAAAAAIVALSACATPTPPPERPALAPTGSPGTGSADPPDGWPFLSGVDASCLEPLGRADTPQTKATIAEAVKAAQPVEYESEAYVVFRGACHFGPKSKGESCRPFVVLSDTRYAGIKSAMSPTLDLVAFVDDSSKWEQFSSHRVRYRLCSLEPGALAARILPLAR